jgi:hypothetical protein
MLDIGSLPYSPAACIHYLLELTPALQPNYRQSGLTIALRELNPIKRTPFNLF